jgi:two-component system, NtrC family, nitrogen regulation response regulator GlnG
VPLAKHFLGQMNDGARANITPTVAKLLLAYHWPGNVRELRNAMEHAAVISGGGTILPAHLPENVRLGGSGPSDGRETEMMHAIQAYLDLLPPGESLHKLAMESLERALIQRTLAQTGGNQSAAADLLGLHRNTLRNKLAEYGMSE